MRRRTRRATQRRAAARRVPEVKARARAGEEPPRRRICARLLGGVGLVLGGVAGGAWWHLQRSLPSFAGERAIPGLSAEVSIVRDAHAIPHVFARSEADAYVALGYAHAQDRAWQLELNRRVGRGTLAALVGEAAVDSDRLFRTLGLKEAAARTLAALDADTRALLDAYARGVNAWIDEGHTLPPEFQLFGATFARWAPEDSVLFSKLMGFQLSGNWSEELFRVRLGAQLSLAQQVAYGTPYPGQTPLPFAAHARVGSMACARAGLRCAREARAWATR